MQSPANQTKVLWAGSALDECFRPSPPHSKLKSHHFQLPTISFASIKTQQQQQQNSTRSHGNNGRGGLLDGSFVAADQLPAIVQIQRKLLAFFYVYAALIVSLYLTYAIYCFYQHTSASSKQHQGTSEVPAAAAATTTGESGGQLAAVAARHSRLVEQQEQDFEQRLHFLERLIETMGADLEETKGRLREREKCACSLSCSFNGTNFRDGQTWQQKCDTCTCAGGKITCSARKCPKLSCDNPVQLAGQCCPTCMKNCKLNKSLLRHGQTVRPNEASGAPAKQCKCNDGLIRCEPVVAAKQPAPLQVRLSADQRAHNKTREYLNSIISAAPQLLALPALRAA